MSMSHSIAKGKFLQDTPYICDNLNQMVEDGVDTVAVPALNLGDVEHLIAGQLDIITPDPFSKDMERINEEHWPTSFQNIIKAIDQGECC